MFGDYGIGPNHVLPTSTTARYTGGLSVFTFLRIRTFLRSGVPGEDLTEAQRAEMEALIDDTAALARYAVFMSVCLRRLLRRIKTPACMYRVRGRLEGLEGHARAAEFRRS